MRFGTPLAPENRVRTRKTARSRPITKNWRKIYAKIFKAAGVGGHPHQFRHTAAKRLLVRGLSAAHVATLLGNTETIVRKHYSKWIPERQEAFEKAIRATWKG